MTENKHFIVDDAGTLIDMETRENYDYMEEVVDLLNEKDKVNEQLKKSIKRQQLSNEECSKYIEELVKENKQLKLENHLLHAKVNRLMNELANCYEKLGW